MFEDYLRKIILGFLLLVVVWGVELYVVEEIQPGVFLVLAFFSMLIGGAFDANNKLFAARCMVFAAVFFILSAAAVMIGFWSTAGLAAVGLVVLWASKWLFKL